MNKLKTRVIHFHRESYVAQYKSYFIFPILGFWKNFHKPFIWNCASYYMLCDKYQPVISKDFDELVEFCNKFDSIQDVDDYHKLQYEQFDIAYKQIDEHYTKLMQRSWTNE